MFDSRSDSPDEPHYGSDESISTANGNKYNNQEHYYSVHGWPEGWEGCNNFESADRIVAMESFDRDGDTSHASTRSASLEPDFDQEIGWSQVSASIA